MHAQKPGAGGRLHADVSCDVNRVQKNPSVPASAWREKEQSGRSI